MIEQHNVVCDWHKRLRNTYYFYNWFYESHPIYSHKLITEMTLIKPQL